MTENKMSKPQQLSEETLSRIVQRFGLSERQGEESGEPWLSLDSKVPMAQGEVGQVRVFTGSPLFRVVTCSIVVPAIQLDSHMIFAFMPSASAVPHFTLDAVNAGGHFAFHLDLIPRVDIGSRLAYMDEVLTPLSGLFEQGRAIEGLEAAHLSPRQLAIMSPWMLANRASEEAFTAIEPVVNGYLSHWFELVENGVSDASLEDIGVAELCARDQRNKAIIFNPDVDKVWAQITPLVGEEAVDRIISVLRETSV